MDIINDFSGFNPGKKKSNHEMFPHRSLIEPWVPTKFILFFCQSLSLWIYRLNNEVNFKKNIVVATYGPPMGPYLVARYLKRVNYYFSL